MQSCGFEMNSLRARSLRAPIGEYSRARRQKRCSSTLSQGLVCESSERMRRSPLGANDSSTHTSPQRILAVFDYGEKGNISQNKGVDRR